MNEFALQYIYEMGSCGASALHLQDGGNGAGRSVVKEQRRQRTAGTQSCSQPSTERVGQLWRETTC